MFHTQDQISGTANSSGSVHILLALPQLMATYQETFVWWKDYSRDALALFFSSVHLYTGITAVDGTILQQLDLKEINLIFIHQFYHLKMPV